MTTLNIVLRLDTIQYQFAFISELSYILIQFMFVY